MAARLILLDLCKDGTGLPYVFIALMANVVSLWVRKVIRSAAEDPFDTLAVKKSEVRERKEVAGM